MSRKTDFAILGILTHGPQSGYDIKKHISGSIGYFWQESYGQLYPALKKLVQQRLVTMRIEKNQGKPDKKVYSITEQGRNSLKNWLKEPVESAPKIRHELLLKLFFGSETDTGRNIQHVREYRQKCIAYLEQLKLIKNNIEEYDKNDPASTYWLITVSSGFHSIKGEIAWCDETIDILTKELE